MKWLNRLIERLTHREAHESRLAQLESHLSRYQELEANYLILKQEQFSRILELEQNRTDIYTRLNILQEDVNEKYDRFQSALSIERTNLDSRFSVLEKDRSELFKYLEALRLDLNAQNNTFCSALEAGQTDFNDRLLVLEKDRTELFARLNILCSDSEGRFLALEKDRTALFEQFDMLRVGSNNRFLVLEEDRSEIFNRLDSVKDCLRSCGFLNVNSRIDSRIIRLEILTYYENKACREKLNSEQILLLETLRNEYDYGRFDGRTYPEDSHYALQPADPLSYVMREEDGLWYTNINDVKVFWGENEQDAKAYFEETIHWLEGDTPHRYLDPPSDDVDIPEGAILLDIGAAEGYFGMRYLKRCKKVYFFECDPKWLVYLNKTCAPYMDKVEIIAGYVGDGPGDIHLDEFFQNREKPTVIKMDVEGAEGAVLRGMPQLLKNPSLPLILLICTYHRQEDWERYCKYLGDQYRITSSHGYYWNMQDPFPPFFRRGVMRAVKKIR